MIVNKAQLAEFVGLSHVTLTGYQDEGLPILHRGARGQEHLYDSAAVIDWLVLHSLARRGAHGAQLGIDLIARLGKKNLDGAGAREAGLTPAAAVYLLGRSAGLAEELETLQGVEAKRAALERSDQEFLQHLRVNGGAMRKVLEEFMAKLPTADVHALYHALALAGVVFGS